MAKQSILEKNENQKKSPALYIVGSPIGNLEDISLRAIRILKEVDFILCEDTRKTGRLLSHFKIKQKLYSCHSQREESRIPLILEEILKNKKSCALISDAGTPCISDPGAKIVKQAIEYDIQVVPIPGANAFVTLLSVSGFGLSNFEFFGFLTNKKLKRKNQLFLLKEKKGTFIFYESPHRIKSFLSDILEVFPSDAKYVIGRELTKTFETVYYGDVKDLSHQIDRFPEKGEYTIIIRNF